MPTIHVNFGSHTSTGTSNGTILPNGIMVQIVQIQPPASPPVPPPVVQAALTILGLDQHYTLDTLRKTYRQKAAQRHPDKGGSDAAMAELNNAREWLLKWNSENRPLVRIQNGRIIPA